MASKTKRKRPAQPPRRTPAPPSRKTLPGLRILLPAAGLVALAAIGIVVVLVRSNGGAPADRAGLPLTPDYHSLLVAPADPSTILLGTHQGVFRSTDGGRNWVPAGLEGDDAMNLARPRTGRTVWLAGHQVFAKSTDGGQSWNQVRPSGLPSLDIHGFAVDPRRPARLYAAVAGQGLYASGDGGRTFAEVSREVGGMVMALAVLPTGEILAGDMGRGLLASRDGGRSWRLLVRARLAGIAVNPKTPSLILAAGPGVIRSTDGGKTWTQPLELDEGAGPVAWSPSDPSRAYVVGFDRTLYRSDDAGETWRAVS